MTSRSPTPPGPRNDQSAPEGKERALPLQGSGKALDEMRYPPLYQHSQRLGRLVERDNADLLAALGIALCGGGVGAWLAGEALESKGVLLSTVIGLVLVVSSRFIRKAEAESAGALKKDFDRDLSLWQAGDEEVKTLHEHLEKWDAEHDAT
jgi:hypothetical protein